MPQRHTPKPTPAPTAQPATPTPPPTQEPPNHAQVTPDGSMPLTTGKPPGRHEEYALYRSQGATQAEAYQNSTTARVKIKSAEAAASELERKPEMRRRIQYLRLRARSDQPAPAPAQAPENAPKAAKTTDIDRDSVVSKLTLALSNAVNPSEIAQVVREILKVMPSVSRETSEDMPDPLAVVRYLCTAGDKRPSDVRKELGGMVWIMGRVQALCSCPPDLLRSAAQTVADTVALREAKRVRR